MTRLNGALLHVSCLPSNYGIGTLGKEAYNFIDFLADVGITCWQMLPINPTSFGDSPYQSPSAFAGNPYFIDLDLLIDGGLLTSLEVDRFPWQSSIVDYGAQYYYKVALLRKAFERFKPDKAYESFVAQSAEWLEDYASFMALKTKFGSVAWIGFPKEFAVRKNLSIMDGCALAHEISFWKFTQYYFDLQMCALVNYAKSRNIELIGDMPFYVAYDSADVWANPQLFKLDDKLYPKTVAGVPPDYFAEDGQLWGNPIYDFRAMKADGFSWWHRRILHSLKYFDKIRIDHFRAFESYFEIPYLATTAKEGKWTKGVGLQVFEGISKEVSGRIIAEDLGIITPAVRKLLKKSCFPGMKVLQFAFDGKAENEYLPQNVLDENTVYYTGTHDNETLLGWYNALDTKAKAEYEKVVGQSANPVYSGIRCVLNSVSNLAVIPMQDYLCLDNRAKMNTPSTFFGNWQWRLPQTYQNYKAIIKSFISNRDIIPSIKLFNKEQ